MFRLPIAAITDEFATDDLDVALDAMSEVGMTGAELRVIGGRNIIDLTDDEVRMPVHAWRRTGCRCSALRRRC